MVEALLLFLILALLGASYRHRLLSDKRHLAEREQFTTSYPVFTESQIREAEGIAAKAATQADYWGQQLDEDLGEGEDLESAERTGVVSPALRARMTKVTQARLEAEWRWHRHARMMDANISVLTGASSRESARKTARNDYSILELLCNTEAYVERWVRLITDAGLLQQLRDTDPASAEYQILFEATYGEGFHQPHFSDWCQVMRGPWPGGKW